MTELRCIHRHSPETHPNCFRKGLIKREDWYHNKRIAYFDIETNGFKADFSLMLSWCLKHKGDDNILFDHVTREELLQGGYDKRIVESLLESLKDVDIIVTYYGTRFDIPFTRSRAEKFNLMFPGYGEMYHWDLYYKVRRSLQLSRNSLGVATSFLGIEGKTAIGNYVLPASYGDEDAMKELLHHNKEDVKILEKLHERLERHSKWIRTSI